MKLDNNDEIDYTYDDRYQLLMETRTNGATQLYKYEWSYDDAGNREWQKKWTTSDNWSHYREYIYNDANQLMDEDQWDTVSKGTKEMHTDYTYDDAGNMTAKDEDTDADDDYDIQWDYTYNYENRQTKVEKDTGGGSAEVGEYKYNTVGNRVEREVNEVLCKGCGMCVSACPSGAAYLKGQPDYESG